MDRRESKQQSQSKIFYSTKLDEESDERYNNCFLWTPDEAISHFHEIGTDTDFFNHITG